MSKEVTVIDIGIGNLASVLKALKDSIALVFAGDMDASLHGDFRAHAHFQYLTGIVDEPGAVQRLQAELGGLITNVQGTGLLFSAELHPDFKCYGENSTEEFMRAHAHEPLTVEQLAEYAGVSVRTLFAGFRDFCDTKYHVNFPLFSKLRINSEPRHPLYVALIAAQPQALASGDSLLRNTLSKHQLLPKGDTDVMWNFEKFLVNKQGEVVARFAPDITADDARIVDAVNAELAK